MSNADAIAQVLRANGLGTEIAARLAAYGEYVLIANRTMNLTAAREAEAFAGQILDSLTLVDDVDGALIDIGSGAGLPGVPLAIATGQRVVLVDSVRKKSQFLQRLLTEFGIAGEAVEGRAERLGSDPAFRGHFRCATARAVSTAPSVAELTVPFLEIGGKALLQRGFMDERERQAVSDAAPMLGAHVAEERLLSGERRILILHKVAPTQARFPRREGIPEKRPLCMS